MDYIRITSIRDPWFAHLHRLMQETYPKEEVLAFDLWEEPLQDQRLRVYVAVHAGEAVGATEYRYLPDLQVAMVDFTIVGRPGLGIGRFLWQRRTADLTQMAAASGRPMLGMFAEVYNPERAGEIPGSAGRVSPMHPVVRREVLSHLGYQRLDFPYVHPSWEANGEAVTELDFCFLPSDPDQTSVPAQLVVDFLTTYYAILPKKPQAWHEMIQRLQGQAEIALLPL